MFQKRAIPAGSLKKREPSKKHTKNNSGLVTEVDEPKSGSLVKLRRWINFMVKFQNLKHNVKNNLNLNNF